MQKQTDLIYVITREYVAQRYYIRRARGRHESVCMFNLAYVVNLDIIDNIERFPQTCHRIGTDKLLNTTY